MAPNVGVHQTGTAEDAAQLISALPKLSERKHNRAPEYEFKTCLNFVHARYRYVCAIWTTATALIYYTFIVCALDELANIWCTPARRLNKNINRARGGRVCDHGVCSVQIQCICCGRVNCERCTHNWTEWMARDATHNSCWIQPFCTDGDCEASGVFLLFRCLVHAIMR